MTSMPITVDESKVLVAINPLDPDELFVDPGEACVDLPRLRHLIPAEWRDAPVHRFEPRGHGCGAWVLRRDVTPDHTPRVFGTDDHWGCVCPACEQYRATRLDLILPIAVDSLIDDALGA